MENVGFHQQLHTLKGRVNALTMQYSPRQAYAAPAAPQLPPSPPEDAFTVQLRDIKAHIGTLQASISKCEASMRQQAPGGVPEPVDNQVAAQTRLSLPSGPVFWQLFNSLRSDFQSLDTRVAGLEDGLNALEDRVDGLDPGQFTPAGSTASHEESGGVQIAQRQNEDLLCPSMACLPELCSEEKTAADSAQAAQHHSRISSLESQKDDAFAWQWPAGGRWADETVNRPYAPPMFQDQVPSYPHQSCGLASNPVAVYPEGVAFRDREIDRMDDQLKVVQESLKSSEALAAAKDESMSYLSARIEELESENQRVAAQAARDAQIKKVQDGQILQLKRELEEQLKRTAGQSREIADSDNALCYWQERCDHEASMYQHAIADRDQALQRWEESYNAASDAWRQENERAVRLGSRLDQYRSERREEIYQLRLSYERELDKLKEFCEHKDAVIVKQERVIARGGGLLEERDAEIDRLHRRVRVLEDGVQHDGVQRKRKARLLDEIQNELEHLRSSRETQEEGRAEGSITGREQLQDEVMAASTEAVDGRPPYEIPGSYPREARRTSDRQRGRRHESPNGSDASAKEAVRTGSPRPRRPRRRESLHQLPEEHADHRRHRHERRPSPPPRPHRAPALEDRNERFAADKADIQPDWPDRRRARFLDDSVISFDGPPLPAPVTARKMASEADLRGAHHAIGRGAGAGRALSKHRSMQELAGTRGRLQAYVETEAESDAAQDGQGRV